jgi:hypothetical protein
LSSAIVFALRIDLVTVWACQTAFPPDFDTARAGRLLMAIIPALGREGFRVADRGLVLAGPEVGGYLEIAFNPLPEGPDAPDADWSDPRWSDPCRWTTLDPADYDASFDEWLAHVDADGYPPADQVEDYLTAFNAARDDSSETPA